MMPLNKKEHKTKTGRPFIYMVQKFVNYLGDNLERENFRSFEGNFRGIISYFTEK